MIEVKGKKCFFTSIITFQLNCWVESCKFYNKLYAILNRNLIMLLQTLNVRQPLISYFRYPEQLLKIVLLWTRNFVWLTSIILFYTVQSPHKNRSQKMQHWMKHFISMYYLWHVSTNNNGQWKQILQSLCRNDSVLSNFIKIVQVFPYSIV